MVKDLRVAGRQSRTGSDHGRPTAKTARLVGIYRTHRALRAVTWNDARMDASFWVAVVALVVSIAAVVVAIVLGVFTVRLARQANANGQAQVAAADQQFRAALDQQREQQHQWEQLQQPNVWADLRPDDGAGWPVDAVCSQLWPYPRAECPGDVRPTVDSGATQKRHARQGAGGAGARDLVSRTGLSVRMESGRCWSHDPASAARRK